VIVLPESLVLTPVLVWFGLVWFGLAWETAGGVEWMFQWG